jgi:hypothetical protein
MRILGIAGIVLALAICGYLVVSYLHAGTKIQETLEAVPPGDVTGRGLEQRLAPTLDQERQRVEQTNKAVTQ